MNLPPRIRIVSRSPPAPHVFVRGTGTVRKYGAPMSNPPSPADMMQDPTCSICRRYPKDPIHIAEAPAP